MRKQFEKYNRIIIIGDAGRGKSTLALRISKKLSIKYYSTDDFFWKKKFTQPEDKQKSLSKILKIYKEEKWIVEGTTRRLLEAGLNKADIIIYMRYKNFLSQWGVLFRRYLTRKNERLIDILLLMKDVFMKRYRLKKSEKKMTYREMVMPYQIKLIELHSFREINEFVNNL